MECEGNHQGLPVWWVGVLQSDCNTLQCGTGRLHGQVTIKKVSDLLTASRASSVEDGYTHGTLSSANQTPYALGSPNMPPMGNLEKKAVMKCAELGESGGPGGITSALLHTNLT
jgi:hypothetical protein